MILKVTTDVTHNVFVALWHVSVSTKFIRKHPCHRIRKRTRRDTPLMLGGRADIYQTFQFSHILRETHAFDIFLTLTRINTIFSRKSEKIGSDPTFVLTLLFASKYSYLAESIAIK